MPIRGQEMGADLGTFGRAVQDRLLARLRVAGFGRVVSFSAASPPARSHPTVSVQPLTDRHQDGGDHARQPVLNGVPVAFLGGRKMRFDFALGDGDLVLLVHSDGDDSALRQLLQTPAVLAAQPVSPMSARRHHLSDAMAIPVASYGMPGQESALKLWDEVCTILQGATVATMLGPQPLDPATQVKLAALRARLAAIM